MGRGEWCQVLGSPPQLGIVFWGEKGWAKVVRGINNMAVESACSWAVPTLPAPRSGEEVAPKVEVVSRIKDAILAKGKGVSKKNAKQMLRQG